VAAGEWTVAVRVAGHGCVWKGLKGSTRADELLARASAEMGVPAGSMASGVWCESRLLRADESLEGAGVPRTGGEMHVRAGEAGGMPLRWSWFGFGSRQRSHVHPTTAGTTLAGWSPGGSLIQVQSELGFQLGDPGAWLAEVGAVPDEPGANSSESDIFSQSDLSMDPAVGLGGGAELAGALGTLLRKLSLDVSGIEGAAQRLGAMSSDRIVPEEARAASTMQAASAGEASNRAQVTWEGEWRGEVVGAEWGEVMLRFGTHRNLDVHLRNVWSSDGIGWCVEGAKLSH
jgi:hypothetical protein